ncbi:MAG: ABC transporter permease subunit [Nitrospirae bacterium]|nr:ABC transporter permease subunit [Nitrospirota bacterium]
MNGDFFRKLTFLLPTVIVVGILSGVVLLFSRTPPSGVPVIPREDLADLPGDILHSLFRLFLAYLLSLAFAYLYGFAAALTRWGPRILIPVLDILQSIPVLGFFPAVVLMMIPLFPTTKMGVEAASVVLIATSMAWNMAFAVYESVRTAPPDLLDLFRGIRAPSGLWVARFLVPLTLPKVVYNSVLSWTAGWYFLIACEMIALGPVHYELPGLGSFLVASTEKGRFGEALLGIGALIVTVMVLDVLVFRPSLVWSHTFQIGEVEGPFSRVSSPVYDFLASSEGLVRLRRRVARTLGRLSRIPWREGRIVPRSLSPSFRFLLRAGGGFLVGFIIAKGLFAGAHVVSGWIRQGIPWASLGELPADLVFSMLRLMAGYLLSLLWTIPLAYWVFRTPRLSRIIFPLAEVMASVPATALFPFVIVLVVQKLHSMNLASVILLMSGMQWYLLFNLLSGVGTFPSELREVSLTFGVRGTLFLRKVFLPFLMPSLVTGSITAFGGGWNALIVSEYVVYAQKDYGVRGVGAFLDRATYSGGHPVLIVAALLVMTAAVVAANRLFWVPLYDRVTRRYGYDV